MKDRKNSKIATGGIKQQPYKPLQIAITTANATGQGVMAHILSSRSGQALINVEDFRARQYDVHAMLQLLTRASAPRRKVGALPNWRTDA